MSDEQMATDVQDDSLASISQDARTAGGGPSGRVQPAHAETSPPTLSIEDDHIALIFRDGLDMPIPGLEFIATLPSGLVCTAQSTASGAIALPVSRSASGQVRVEVKDTAGNKQQVCAIDVAKCEGAVIVRSPKIKAQVALQPHQQVARAPAKPTAAKPAVAPGKPAAGTKPKPVDVHQNWWSANGALHKAWEWIAQLHLFDEAAAAPLKKATGASAGLSSAGQPVAAVVGPEVPTQDNLRLGRNNIYREPILEASKRLGLIPQALCALMDCEAGKISEKLPVLKPDGSQAKDKKGKPLFKVIAERWNANAGNAQSGAAGLTQFLASTWLTHVLMPGYYIHEKSVANGWVRQEADSHGKKRWVFVLSHGGTTTRPYNNRQDDNVMHCLAMRMDPAWSINAAADYGNANLKVLERAKFDLSGLNGMERAKLMYLMHHEGEGCGVLFVKNKLRDRKDGCGGVDRLRQVFAMQLGSNGDAIASEKIDRADGDVEVAYREWLSDFIDTKFQAATKYFYNELMSSRSISRIFVAVGGERVL